MAFQQGISGLNAAAKALDVSGNNIANAATVGFKSSRTNFGDVFAASMLAGSGGQVGLGVNVTAVQQQFTQGNMTATSNALDIGINGEGFYRLGGLQSSTGTLSGAETYTRNGQFHLSKDGFIINDQGLALLGVQVGANGTIPAVSGTNLGAINVNIGVGVPKATTATTTLANLNSQALTGTIPTAGTPSTYSGASFNRGMDVYDSQGAAHSLTTYYTKTAANTWDVFTTLSDTNVTTGAPLTVVDPVTGQTVSAPLEAPEKFTLAFNANGLLSTVTNQTTGTVYNVDSKSNPPVYTDAGTGAVTPAANFMTVNFAGTPGVSSIGGTANGNQVNAMAVTLNLGNLTQFDSQYVVDKMTQDGYPKGKLAGLNVDADGNVQAQYDNGKTSNIARIPLFSFANPNGLQNKGNNQWAETLESGSSVANYAGVGSAGVLQSYAVEDSNVDLTKELVNLIIEQRNYQANAQTIKTQDQVMQTLVNLR
ncbi:MAG: hypothetical protein RIR18_338 [Pseudomonadota bacterium]|jgi:flagellar hook protein FlgE